jgi:FlaA1/EpsC-like NDP-sugar epimerase
MKMTGKKQLLIRRTLLAILDAASVFLAIWLGIVLRFNSFTNPDYTNSIILIGAIYASAIVIVYVFFGLYRSVWKFASVEELVKLIILSLIIVIAMFILNFLLGRRLPNSTFAIAFLLQTALSGGTRFSYRIVKVFKKSVIGTPYETDSTDKIIIIGGGYEAVATIKSFREGNNRGIIVALIDRYNTVGSYIHNIPIRGKLSDLENVIKDTGANEVIIASEYFTEDDVSYTLDVCSNTKCKLKKYNSVGEVGGRNRVVEIDPTDLLGRPQVNLNTTEICGYINSKTILVTGGGGSIGSELIKQLVKFEPARLVIFDINENYAYLTQVELSSKYPKVIVDVEIGSIRDENRVCGIFEKYRPAVVFHAAAHKHVPLMEKCPSEALKNNIIGTYLIAQYAVKFKSERFVLISTDKAVNPTNIMGASKRVAELIVSAFDKVSKTEFTAVRFGNVLGSSGSVIPIFKQQILSGGPVKVTHPEVRRFFMTIPEACQLVIQAGAMAKGGEIFILDMQKPVKVKDLAESMIMMYGMIPGVDIEIEYIGLRPGEKLYEELMQDEEVMVTSNDKIFVAKTNSFDMEYIEAYVKEVKKTIEETTEFNKITKLLQKAVPEFKPIDPKIINEL